MPITVTHPIKLLSEREFHQLDFHVMRLAFEAHNQLGRFYNEEIYKNKLVELCKNEGLDARTEVKIELTHGQFHKNLFIDTVIDSASIYELKTAIRSLFSPATEITQPVEIKSGSLLLGKQNLPLISPTETFTVSSQIKIILTLIILTE